MSSDWPPFINGLVHHGRFDHPVNEIRVVETHLSWVILTGPYAYKIKKPVEFGFVDFSTRELRSQTCFEELRLNKLISPALYVDVVGICGPADAPIVCAAESCNEETLIEHAVRMRQFPSGSLLVDLATAGKLTSRHIDQLAECIAALHAAVPVAGPDDGFGTPEKVALPIEENFRLLDDLPDSAQPDLEELRAWSYDAVTAATPHFAQRLQEGFVRECHGDLHLGNIVQLEEAPALFDCLEFNANYRWIDVISDIAFCVMDVQDHATADLSRRLLDRYLSITGDYEGLHVLRCYLVYRSVVRAKVEWLRAKQLSKPITDDTPAWQRFLDLAKTLARPPSRPQLVITFGLSGSGKTTVSQKLVEQLGMIRVRSDVERKRLCGRTALESVPGAAYQPEMTDQTYARLAELAKCCLTAGFSVAVDATFLRRRHRRVLQEIADDQQVPMRIVVCNASDETLATRIATRREHGTDASDATEAIVSQQRERMEELDEREMSIAFTVQSDQDVERLLETLAE